VILLGARHLRRTIAEFVAYYRGERNHQGIGHELIQPLAGTGSSTLTNRWHAELLLTSPRSPMHFGGTVGHYGFRRW
jgi:hypothetical protein